MIRISKATPENAPSIARLARETFVETYGDLDEGKWIDSYIADHFSEERLQKELDSQDAYFFLANVENESAGFTKLRTDRTARGLEERKTIEIERIYVLKEFQGFKVGKELIGTSLATARELAMELVWLQVWQNNTRAVEFYQKAGFVVFDTAEFKYEGAVHQDYLMRLDIYY